MGNHPTFINQRTSYKYNKWPIFIKKCQGRVTTRVLRIKSGPRFALTGTQSPKSLFEIHVSKTSPFHLAPQGICLHPSTKCGDSHWINNSMNNNSWNNKKGFLLAHMTWKFQIRWLQAWLYPAAQVMLSHPTHLLVQLSCVGWLCSQPGFFPLAALVHHLGNCQGKKVPLSQ